jgi:hypothetical protein
MKARLGAGEIDPKKMRFLGDQNVKLGHYPELDACDDEFEIRRCRGGAGPCAHL